MFVGQVFDRLTLKVGTSLSVCIRICTFLKYLILFYLFLTD